MGVCTRKTNGALSTYKQKMTYYSTGALEHTDIFPQETSEIKSCLSFLLFHVNAVSALDSRVMNCMKIFKSRHS